MYIEIRSRSDLESKLNENNDKLLLLYFWARWCRPCVLIAPKMQAVEEQYPDMLILKIDADENDEILALFKIEILPTFYFMKNKIFIHNMIGSNFEKLKDKIAKYYNFNLSTLKEPKKTYDNLLEEEQNRLIAAKVTNIQEVQLSTGSERTINGLQSDLKIKKDESSKTLTKNPSISREKTSGSINAAGNKNELIPFESSSTVASKKSVVSEAPSKKSRVSEAVSKKSVVSEEADKKRKGGSKKSVSSEASSNTKRSSNAGSTESEQ